MISLPLYRGADDCFAVVQLRNRCDGQAFDVNDEKNLSRFTGGISILLETAADLLPAAGSN